MSVAQFFYLVRQAHVINMSRRNEQVLDIQMGIGASTNKQANAALRRRLKEFKAWLNEQ